MWPSAPEAIPVFILCGGLGSRLGNLTAARPKPMIEVDGAPLITHIMRSYALFGFRRFVLCAGYRSDVISSYFLDYAAIANDVTIDLATRNVSVHQSPGAPNWEVTVAHTGLSTMTGGRLARAAGRYLGDNEHFAVTYGDGLTDADLAAELDFHLSHGSLGTVLGVQPASPFGHFLPNNGFVEKPRMTEGWVSGGFFFFRKGFLDYLSTDEGCVLEHRPLSRLRKDGQLEVFEHQGFWSAVDTPRDHKEVQALCEEGAPPWLGPVEPCG